MKIARIQNSIELGPSMNDNSSLIALLFVIWFFSQSPSSLKPANVYFATCQTGWDGWKCKSFEKTPAPIKVTYVLEPSQSSIVYKYPWLNPEILEKCTILDSDNWECPSPIPASATSYYCREGECDFGVLGDNTVRQTGIIWYYVLKLLSYVG